MSSPNFEQIASAQKANAEVMTALLRTALNGMERLTALNMAATRDFLNSSMSNTQRLLAAKDANALGKLQSDLAQPGMEKLLARPFTISKLSGNLASSFERLTRPDGR